jgi:hypothetical protein
VIDEGEKKGGNFPKICEYVGLRSFPSKILSAGLIIASLLCISAKAVGAKGVHWEEKEGGACKNM